jgi:hypothetical protein
MSMRFYDVNVDGRDISLASVTTIIDQINEKGHAGKPLWKFNLEDARIRGNDVHSFVNNFLITRDQLTPEEFNSKPIKTQNCMRAFTRWWLSNDNMTVRHIEYRLINLEEMFAGTADLVAYFRKKRGVYITDWKTGFPIEVNHIMQISAYVMTYNLMHPRRKIDGGIIVYLDGNTSLASEKVLSFNECKFHYQEFIRLKKEVGI